MKPMIIYDMEIVDNKVHIDKDKFEKLCRDIYNDGFNDGMHSKLEYKPIIDHYKEANQGRCTFDE